ncbi:hypothetical protein [Candidatus Poriferisodalis sp.]|uniref:hypothetical protein n=1 Tax=Candidatus Poriferisodalis sp. TaxID=3101277 RepID=UPI003B5C2EAD
MPWFEAARDRCIGKAAGWLEDKLSHNLDSRIEALLIAAVDKWQQDNWCRFGKSTAKWNEVDCTVQMYRWSRECIRHESRFTLMTVRLEWIDVTPEILRGIQSVTTARRPDLRIEAGSVGRSIECKRIASASRWVRNYVHKGLARFVTGNYGHAENSGFMIGYASGGQLPDLIARINGYIRSHPNMGSGQVVTTGRRSPPILLGISRHARSSGRLVLSDIKISHLLVKLDS